MKNQQTMRKEPYTFDKVVRMIIGASIGVLILLLIQRLSNVLLPFILGWFLAYLLHPVVIFFQFKLKLKSRIVSILITLTLFIAVLTGLLLIIIPLINNEIIKISELEYFKSGWINISHLIPSELQAQINVFFSHFDIKAILGNNTLLEAFNKITPQIWKLLNSSFNFVMGFTVVIIVFLYLIFILLDYEKITESIFSMIPRKMRPITKEIFRDLEFAMNQYFRGQALVALIVTILFCIGFSIIQLPLAIVMGILIGIFTLVPYLKITLVIPVYILGWVKSIETNDSIWGILIGITIVFVLIQTIEDTILTPKIMGKATGLNPAIILLSLSIWGSLLGIIGMIIALPLTTIIISYYKRFILQDKKSRIKLHKKVASPLD